MGRLLGRQVEIVGVVGGEFFEYDASRVGVFEVGLEFPTAFGLDLNIEFGVDPFVHNHIEKLRAVVLLDFPGADYHRVDGIDLCLALGLDLGFAESFPVEDDDLR